MPDQRLNLEIDKPLGIEPMTPAGEKRVEQIANEAAGKANKREKVEDKENPIFSN